MPKNKMSYPCKSCTRVANKHNCGKDCLTWQAWFFAEWKKFNNYFAVYMREAENAK